MLGRSIAGCLAVCWAVGVAVSVVRAAPKAAATSQAWQLEFRFEDPKRLVVRLPGEDKPRVYWYMLYKVINNSGRDVQFLPTFEIVTDTLKVVRAEPGVDPTIFKAIKRMYAKTRPLLLEPLDAVGKLLQGEDNAKESVAIWPDFSPRSGRFSVFIAGLSGQTVAVANPSYDPTRPEYEVRKLPNGQQLKILVNPRRFVLRKTLRIPYTLPGDRQTRHEATCVRGQVEWLMR